MGSQYSSTPVLQYFSIRVSPTGFKASRQGSRFYLPLVLGPAWVTGVGRAVWCHRVWLLSTDYRLLS